MKRQIPRERWRVFVTVAATSKTQRVLVVCRSRAVRHQYERAVPRLGGDLTNVVFRILSAPPDEEGSACAQ